MAEDEHFILLAEKNPSEELLQYFGQVEHSFRMFVGETGLGCHEGQFDIGAPECSG